MAIRYIFHLSFKICHYFILFLAPTPIQLIDMWGAHFSLHYLHFIRPHFLFILPESQPHTALSLMSANTTPFLPITGTSPPVQALNTADHGLWTYNVMARLVTHKPDACSDCANWAQHYMSHVLRKDPSLALAETQRTDTIRAGLDTEIATLSMNNAMLQTELGAVCDELVSARSSLSSADDEIYHLCDEVDDLWDDTDGVIHGLRDQVDDLKHQLRDLKRGQSTRHRKVPHFGSPTPPPDYSRQASCQPYRPISPTLEAGDVVSTTPPPRLLSRLTALPTAASSSSSSIVEIPSPIAHLLPVTGGLASRMTDEIYEVDSFTPPTSAFATPWAGNLGFRALLPIIYYGDCNLLAAVPGSVILDAQGNVYFKAHSHFVLASGGVYNGQPVWRTTLMPRVQFITLDALNTRAAHLPIPLLGVTLGGSNGVLISLDDPSTEEAVNRLLRTTKHHRKAAVYIERVQWTPPELREALHQHALDRWPSILMSRRGAKIPLQSEPLPWGDDNTWRRWLKEMWEHPNFKGAYQYIGLPLVNGGYLTAHLTGLKALLSFLPLTLQGTVTSGDPRHSFLRSAAALLLVPERYSQTLSHMGTVIAPLRLDKPYDIARFGQVRDLNMEAMACLLASYGVTTDEAETWRAWACAYVEMDLLAHPTSTHAPLLRLAWDRAHERIDADLSWVLKRLDPLAPGHYNPNRAARDSRRHTAAIPASNAVAGSSSAVDNDMPRPPLVPEDDVAHAGYSDDLSEETQMGPV